MAHKSCYASARYIFFCRPLLLIPVWTVFLLLYDFEYSNSPFTFEQLLNLTLISSLTASGYVINQIFDRRSDSINNKLGFLEPPISLKLSFAWTLYAALILSSYVFAFNHIELLAPFSASVIVGLLYSAPLFRGKDRPFAGLVLNAIPYSVIIWWALVAQERGAIEAFALMSPTSAQTLSSLVCALGGIYLITTIPDMSGDAKTNKQTIAVRFGPRVALKGAVGLLFGSLLFGVLADSMALYVTAAFATALSVVALLTGKSGHMLLAAKAPILVLSAFVAYQHPAYGVFLLALVALTRLYYQKRFGIVYPKLA